MPLPHFVNIPPNAPPGGPGTLPYEPVYKNLFEINFVFPLILQLQGRDKDELMFQATSVSMDLTPDIETTSQKFKFSTRVFMKMPEKTHTEFEIKFNVNADNNGTFDTWTTLRAWYDLVWNSQDGTTAYKSDIIGTIIVNQHDKKGVVIRRVRFVNVQIKGVSGIELSWEGSDIWDVTGKFVADYWVDEFIDGNFTLVPPLIPGYIGF